MALTLLATAQTRHESRVVAPFLQLRVDCLGTLYTDSFALASCSSPGTFHHNEGCPVESGRVAQLAEQLTLNQ
jgi:hypothetical protein